ncbi:MAG: hypothetical protein ACKOFB_02310 [bacterium]
MKLQSILDDMLSLAHDLNYSVRREKGNFRGGDCRVNDDRFIVLNSLIPLESRIVLLARILAKHDLHNRELKPAVKAVIEKEKGKDGTGRTIELDFPTDA